MVRRHRWLIPGLVAVCVLALPVHAAPPVTADAINAYAQECIDAQIAMDLIARFGTDYRGLELSGVNFRGLHAAYKETNLNGADFTGATLTGAQFGASHLRDAVFRDADLSGAHFVTADLRGADFTGATFGDAHFQECDFTAADLPNLDAPSATFNACRFGEADLSNARLAAVANDMWWPEFSGANLAGADLSGLRLAHGRLSHAILRDASLRGADLTQADLTGADLSGADLTGVTVTHAVLDSVTGLAPETLAALVQRADRGSFDRQQARAESWERWRPALYGAAIIITITLLIVGIVRSDVRWWAVVFLIANVAAAVAPITLLLMGVVGGSPTAQLSGGAAGDAAWQLWFFIWPLSLLLAFALVPLVAVGLGWTLALIARGKQRAGGWVVAGIAGTAVHAGFLFWLLGTYFPDA